MYLFFQFSKQFSTGKKQLAKLANTLNQLLVIYAFCELSPVFGEDLILTTPIEPTRNVNNHGPLGLDSLTAALIKVTKKNVNLIRRLTNVCE